MYSILSSLGVHASVNATITSHVGVRTREVENSFVMHMSSNELVPRFRKCLVRAVTQ
jgi:hypothetical protein